MISRNWRGMARADEADNYILHLQTETFPQLARIAGFVSASILSRPTAVGVEFLIVTTWDSMDAIRQFAGEPEDVAVVPPAVQAMMIDYDSRVVHYQIADTFRPAMSSTQLIAQRERREAVVLDHVAAENAGDIDATVATFHRPRYNVLPMGAVSDGEEAVRQLVGGLVTAFPDFHFEIKKLHHADDSVIVEGVMTGTHKGDWAGIGARGNRMELPVACVFDFEDDRLVNESVYFDFATLQRQLTV